MGHEFARDTTILEVGCATGSLSEYMVARGYDVTGVDASSTMIAAAKSSKHNAEYHVANANKLPFEDNVFDAVVSASLINIIPDKRKALAEMARVCKPGGIISVYVPAQGFDTKSLQNLVSSRSITGFSETVLETWHNFAPKLDKQEVQTLFLEVGLTPRPAQEYLHGLVFSMAASKAI